MSFWEHLEELRWRLVKSAGAIIFFGIIAFINREVIFDEIILAPKDSNFISYKALCWLADYINVQTLCLGNFTLDIVNIQMSGQFMTHMTVAMVAGIIAAFPFVFWQIWKFINPALMPKEKKYTKGAVAATSFLFLIGILFSYFLLVPLTVNFFATYQVSEEVKNTISLSSYISTVVSVTLATGIVFQLPIVVYFLTKVGLITPAFLKKNRKYVLVLLLIIAAVITPPDIFSQILVTIPLMGLYEISILLSNRIYKKNLAKELAG